KDFQRGLNGANRNSWVARFLGPSGGAASAFLMGVPLLARSSTFQVLSAGGSPRKSKRAGPTSQKTRGFGSIFEPMLDNQPNLVQVGSLRRAKGTLRVLHDLRLLHAVKQASKIGHTNRIRPSICILLAHFIQR